MKFKAPQLFRAVSRPVFFLFLVSGVLCPVSLRAQAQVQSYAQLLTAIRQTRHDSQARIETAVRQEKVREAWETGKLIQEHILLNKDRAEYGKKVMERLASDLGTSERELNYMVEFAREYPIAPTSAQLSWGHYRDLLAINDAKQRDEIAKEAAENKWPLEEMRQQMRKKKLSAERSTLPAKLPEVKPGKIGARAVIELNGKHYEDLGFSFYKETSKPVQTPPLEDLYTYHAQVTEVYDGDTFHALVDFGFGTVLEQRFRLRQLDAPEIPSSEGQEAKAVLQKALSRAKGPILIKVSKSDDQYGRYLVDVFIAAKFSESDSEGRSRMGENYRSINQELLDSGVFTVRGDA